MSKRKTSSNDGKRASSPSLDIFKTASRLPNSPALKVGNSGGLTKLAIGQKFTATQLQFGSPSSRGSSSVSNKMKGSWTSLLGSIASNGLSDLLDGGGVLNSGLDYLAGGFESLFGGGFTSDDTATRFELSDAQDRSISVNNVKAAANPSSSSGIYSESRSQISQASKVAIVQTVRNALLTSSSLNDVIGEL